MDIVAVVLAITAVLLSFVYIAKFWAKRAKLHSVINKIPGPPTYPFIGTTYIYLRSTRRGQKFALLEEKTILSYILRRFKIQFLDRREEVHPIPLVVLRPEHGIKVTLISRS